MLVESVILEHGRVLSLPIRKQNILPDTEESWELEDVAETIIDLLEDKICY